MVRPVSIEGRVHIAKCLYKIVDSSCALHIRQLQLQGFLICDLPFAEPLLKILRAWWLADFSVLCEYLLLPGLVCSCKLLLKLCENLLW